MAIASHSFGACDADLLAANGPNVFQPPADASATLINCPVKKEAIPRDTTMAGAPSSSTIPTTDPATKQPSINDRVQKLISNGSPEELEAEVKICQAFLSELKKPLDGFTEQNKDAQHWVAQIGALYSFPSISICAKLQQNNCRSKKLIHLQSSALSVTQVPEKVVSSMPCSKRNAWCQQIACELALLS